MNKRNVLLVGLFLGISSLGWAADPIRFSLKDLEALAAQKNWNELLVHLSDIAPAERNAAWADLVGQGCLRPDVDDYLAAACHPYLMSALELKKGNAEWAWTAGKWAQVHLRASAATPFFAKALKADDPRCADESVRESVISALNLPAASKDVSIAEAQILTYDLCWASLKEPVVGGISGSNTPFLQNACPGLMKKGALKGLKASFCQKHHP